MNAVVDRLPSMPEILRACAQHFALTTAQIKHGRPVASIVYARHIAMFLCRVDARRSYPEIGRFFDRDHTTVMSADRKIFARRELGDLQLEADLRQIRRLLELAMGLVQTASLACQECRMLQEQNEQLQHELKAVKQENMAMRVRFGCN